MKRFLKSESHIRLKAAREAVGLPPEEVASRAGIESAAYYDMEQCDADLTYATDLSEIARICRVVKTTPIALFGGLADQLEPITPPMLVAAIQQHLSLHGLSLSQFERQVGYDIGDSLINPADVMNWNVECLQSVCDELGISWLAALPTQPNQVG